MSIVSCKICRRNVERVRQRPHSLITINHIPLPYHLTYVFPVANIMLHMTLQQYEPFVWDVADEFGVEGTLEAFAYCLYGRAWCSLIQQKLLVCVTHKNNGLLANWDTHRQPQEHRAALHTVGANFRQFGSSIQACSHKPGVSSRWIGVSIPPPYH